MEIENQIENQSEKFNIQDLDDIKYYLGIEVIKDDNSAFFASQTT